MVSYKGSLMKHQLGNNDTDWNANVQSTTYRNDH